MRKIMKILALVGIIAIAAVSINALQNPPTDENQTEKLVNDYKIHAIPVPMDLEFAGEPVPMESPDIYERMDRELLVNVYWQSNALLLLKRANKYLPIIEPILAEEGVPDDFKYIAVIESSLTQAVSPAGARGFWQFMEATGKEYGLEINENVDERYHIEKSTRAAAEYFKKSKERFGSWTLAAAAYNAGDHGISRQLERQQVNDYYELLLGEETGRYVFRILAIKEILESPEKYGYHFREKDLWRDIPSHKIKVDTAVSNFADFAQDLGINYKILKIHNPWLREAHLNNNSGKEYLIEIPEEGIYTMIE
ncbi:MAG TPA: lytic transglycosylase domain-containing protein [Salinimicrobium sp.]|nr:lytic transglycosylase domain-containing protein [Salinimicrobium sp.]